MAHSVLDLYRGALDAVPHGVGVLDADWRIVLCNARFCALFGADSPDSCIGTPIRELLLHSAGCGDLHDGDRGEAWRPHRVRLAEGAPFSLLQPTGSGTVALNYQPTGDGGWTVLCEEVTARQQAEEELRAQTARFARALDHLAHGLALYGPDERLVFCNSRYIAALGLDPQVMRPGVPVGEVIRHAMARGLHAGLSIGDLHRQAHGGPAEGGVVRRLPDGRFMALRQWATPDGGWVATCEDVTASERAAEDLREQHRRFDAALNNMSQALCMFDAEHRLIVCNQRYVSLFRADPAVVKPGVTLRGVFEHGVKRGIYPGLTADDLVARRLAALAGGKARTYDQLMADGRIIEVSLRPMASGGWIGMFDDVTEQRRAEADHARAIAELRERNLLFDATLDSMAQGLCVYDASMKLIVRNRRYLEIYRLTPEEAAPGMAMIDVIRASVARGVHVPGFDAEAVHADFTSRLIQENAPVLHRRLADGRIIAIRARPMANGGLVATFEDITEREQAAEALREQHRRFDAALNNMPTGLIMLNERLEVIVCNRRYLEMYRMSPDVVKPGATLHDIAAHSVAIGNYHDKTADEIVENYLERLGRGNYVAHRELADGRIFKVVYQPMEHGGWVSVHEDVTERRKAEQHIAYIAHHDALTDLPNRVLFREKMTEGLARTARVGAPLAVLCLDLDHFKSVNDTLGHPVGDRLLRAVADRAGRAVGAEGMLARLGGDELAILMPGAGPDEAAALARRLVKIMAEPFAIDGDVIDTGLSIGIAVAPRDGLEADELMKCADLALYKAKAEGRGTLRFFEPEMSARIEARRSLELDLRRALAADQFQLVFQPQVRPACRTLTCFEALLRWRHPVRGLVAPSEFIPVAEETGLIGPIGEWALREACRQAAGWPAEVKVAVNFSPVQFRKRNLVATVQAALAEAGLPAHRLEIEITEAVLLRNEEATIAMLHALRALGIRISMDDFGVGYSSLSYLRSFPFDKIKIDRSFIAGLGDAGNAAIVRAMADLGASLGVDTTAEGVETAEQLDLVRRCGCTEVQGYFISHPEPAAAVPALIERLARHVAAA